MTLRIKTLTAVAALTISATGFALAQDIDTLVPVEPSEQQAAPRDAQSGPTVEPFAEPQPQVGLVPAEDAPAAVVPPEAVPAEGPGTTVEVPEPPTAAPPQDTPESEPEEPAAFQEPDGAGNLPQNPAAQQPNVGDDGVNAVALPEGNETSVPVPTMTGTEPVEEQATEVLGAEAAEEHNEEEHGSSGDHGAGHIEDIDFSFEGPFGSFDQFQLQRGLQVYTEVCGACHGMKFVPIRTLADEGGPALPEDQVRAYATNLLPIFDDSIDEERARVLTDNFPEISGAGMGPDLSLMAKARAGFHGPYGTGISQLVNGMGGPEYIHAILTSYTGEEMEQAGTLLYGNSAFPGGWISMPPPLTEDRVTYEDGTPATVDQMATDIAAFLMWTAEPKLMDRKSVGLVSVLFLLALAVLLYLTNKRLWARHKVKRKH
ncbi:MAG: cytochrome c1 [Paracoccus sp. (in: a-proteobacteria)]|uniref:cytochrome c1 n=1 Tax=Paracoccaceae TaxID=31989 RepID=UPI004059C2A6